MDNYPHLPKYQCFKVVRALKITAIAKTADQLGFILYGAEASVNVSIGWKLEFKPVVGGYFVVYEDGYTSFSPEHAFEAGYQLCSQY